MLFALATVWTTVVPGVPLVRALRRRPRTLLGEVCGGYVAGTGALIGALVVAVSLGEGRLVLLYPAVVLGVFAGVPGLRSLLRHQTYPDRTPARAGWLLTAAYLLLVLREATPFLRGTQLPPETGYWYDDLPWNLGIAIELTRAVPPQDPQVAGTGLTYHWFSHAQMAALSLASDVDVAVVFTKLWILPTYAAGLGMTYLLGRRLAGSPWAGVIAAWCAALPASTYLARFLPQHAENPFGAMSPSQVFGVPLLLAACWLLVDAVRGQLSRPGWIALPLVLVACAGAKSSILPTLVAGMAFAGVIMLLTRRPWRQALAALGLVVLTVVVTMPWLAGGRSASHLDPLLLTRQGSYLSAESASLATPWLVVTFAVVLIALLLQKAHLLAVLGSGETRSDPAVWFLAGCVLAGWAAANVIDHSGQSQYYFLMGVQPLIGVLAGWGLVGAWQAADDDPVRRRQVVLRGALAGAALQGLLWVPSRDWAQVSSTADVVRLLGVLLLPIGIFLAVGWRVRRHRVRAEPQAATTLSLAAVVALLVGTALPSLWQGGVRLADDVGRGVPGRHLDSAEIDGALWITRNTPTTDVIATNVHRLPATAPAEYREFWVAAYTARRTYLGSWGYTDEAFAADGVDGHSYIQQPFHDRARFRRNEVAFTDPTQDNLAALYRRGVRWLYANRFAGPVSPRLDDLATLRFAEDGVRVFQLRAPGAH